MRLSPALLGICLAASSHASAIARRQASAPSLEACPGYAASNVQDEGTRLTADLSLAGPACNAYSEDLKSLKLEVEYQTGMSRFQHCAGACSIETDGVCREPSPRQDLRCG